MAAKISSHSAILGATPDRAQNRNRTCTSFET